MGLITIKNIKIYAFHGCLAEEGIIGCEYVINLSIRADLQEAANTDNLIDTVDYVLLQKIVVREMAKRSNLLEHVGQRIINAIFSEIEMVKQIKVKVAKVNPPIGGDVSEVSVTILGER